MPDGFSLDPILGAPLLGTWLASLLFGIVIVEGYKYFTTFPDDSPLRKGLVMLVLGLCVTALVGDYATTYYPTVTFWGNLEALGATPWSLPLASFVNTITATIVDTYLIHRLYTLTKNLWVTIFLYGLLILALGGYMIVFVLLAMRCNQQQLHIETIGAFVNFIAVAVVDILTAAGLIWKLWTMRSNFAQTNTFLNRVMVGAIQTGSVTAVCSLLILATFVNNPNNAVSAFFLYQFAPLYTLTLLFNFNLRQAGRSATSKTSESRNGNTNILLAEGIHVHRTTLVTMNPTDSVADATNRRLDDLEEIKHNPNGSDVGDHGARNVMVKMKN